MRQQFDNLDEVIKIIQVYLKEESVTSLIHEFNLSQSNIYRYRNDPNALASAKFSTICKLYKKANEKGRGLN